MRANHQYGFRENSGTREAILSLRIKSEFRDKKSLIIGICGPKDSINWKSVFEGELVSITILSYWLCFCQSKL